MSALIDSEALTILRRIEPALEQMRRDMTAVQVALATKPGRAELWGALALMVALFAVALGGLAIVLPLVAKHLGQ